MPTLADRIRDVSHLTDAQAEHLRALCSSWQVLADLSFSDLLLYVPAREGRRTAGDVFQISAQLRPFTSQTLYPHDMVGVRVTQPEQPIVERAFREGAIWAQEDPVLVDGIPIQMDAVPVRHKGRVIAVVTKEGSPATSRRPGRLEEVYLLAAERVSEMICEGWFPFPETPAGDWPRIGDGLFVLDESRQITWASPNAVSALRSLGFKQNLLGHTLDELGVGTTPVDAALSARRLLDGELERGDALIRLRVVPLIGSNGVCGGLVLARDITDLRLRDRMLSVKDATIREIHHRVKNNLQTIASLLRLQARRVGNQEARAALHESMLRIGSIALVHETLSEGAADVADFGEVVRRIAHMVAEGLLLPDRRVTLSVTGSTGPLGADIATPLAVTVTELLQNSIEHAFPEDGDGKISVELARGDDYVTVVVRDDGVGIESASSEGTRLGLQIVRTLVEEMGGRFTIVSDGGTCAELAIPLRNR